jgi:DNA-binding NtrC family response regulator
MAEPAGILIVDDEPDFAAGLKRQLARRFPQESIMVAQSGEEALSLLKRQPAQVMLTDLRMSAMSGLELLGKALEMEPYLSPVMLSAYGNIETAVEALKAGAYDFLTKPVDFENLFRVISKALERSRLLGENRRLKKLVDQSSSGPALIGESPALLRLKETIAAVAQSDYTVLIRGDSGTGKELVARTIHGLSQRRKKPLVTVNCPAIPDQLLESELFGHVKGAFTGAEQEHTGLFVTADKGTILLDEIGDISLSIQLKLLRCVQEQDVRPVGSNQSHKVDVRILASTNQNLEDRIQEKTFREDLFYRLNVLSIMVPTLDERREDIPLLVQYFIDQICREMKTCIKRITPETISYLAAKDWPGNVRQLLNFVRRLAVFGANEVVDLNVVRLVESQNYPGSPDPDQLTPYKDAKAQVLDSFTTAYVDSLLKAAGGNVSEAARLSGLERVSLQKILKRHGIDSAKYKSA